MKTGSKTESDFFRYSGRSMWPIFQEGDLLEVQPVSLKKLRVGDCITYRMSNCGTLVTHRIVTVRGENILTRGDARPGPDELSVNINQLVGRVVGRFRLGNLKPVQGGIIGILAGGFYRYAGRLDPQRNTRGGLAARLLRGSLQWLVAGIYRRGVVQEFGDSEKTSNCYWITGKRPWARFDHLQEGWVVPWPQSLLIDPARLPRHHQRKG